MFKFLFQHVFTHAKPQSTQRQTFVDEIAETTYPVFCGKTNIRN